LYRLSPSIFFFVWLNCTSHLPIFTNQQFRLYVKNNNFGPLALAPFVKVKS